VPHLHWHLFPRFSDDPARLSPVWLAVDASERDPALRSRLAGNERDRPATTSALQQALTSLDAAQP
jgi:diadenosine tetraphosphate (Ap4A) HIT family hydrolase